MRALAPVAVILAAALSTPAAAQDADSQVACPYAESQKPPLTPRILTATEEWKPSPELLSRLRPALEVCAKRYGWTEEKRKPAAMYAIAKSGLTENVPLLDHYGLTIELVQEFYAKIGAKGVSAMLDGEWTDQQKLEEYLFLEQRDPKIASLRDDEMEPMGQVFGRVLAALYLIEKAKGDFAQVPAQ